MTELHPSISAVGTHFDEEVETALHAPASQMENERAPGNRATEYRMRDGKASSVAKQQAFLPDNTDRQVEEMMHLDQ